MPERKAFQFAKNLIPMLSIEVWRLKTECVQIYILCTTLPRFLFSKRQKAMPIPATTKFVFSPQQIYIEPISVCCAHHTSYNCLVRRVKNET